MKAYVVAAARVIEARLRTSPRTRRLGRDVIAMLARRSREVRAFVRLHVAKMVRV